MDKKFLFLINREWTSAAADRFMALFSSWDAWSPVAALALLGLLVWGGFRGRAFVICVGIVVGLNDGVISNGMKQLVDRPRPHQSMNDVRIVDLVRASPRLLAVFKPVKSKMSRIDLGELDGRSFPSSHTVNTASVAVLTVCFFGWRAAWAFLLPFTVGYSRIYTGAHWPSDVIVSLLLGAGTTLLMFAALDALWRRKGAALWPDLHAHHPQLLSI